VLQWVAGLMLGAGAASTLAGLMAPLVPTLDGINHFRPLILIGGVACVAVAYLGGSARQLRAASGLAIINAALLALPMLTSAATTQGQARASSGGLLTIMTFNMATTPRAVDNVAELILARAPDIVVLQEVTRAHAEPLHRRLGARYPWRHTCTHMQGCSQMLLSRHPWAQAQHVYRASGGPEMVWARFDDRSLGRLHVHGLHMAWPFRPETQVRHVDRLIEHSREVAGPAIYAGDFNLTPWSYQLQRLQWRTGLRRHATALRSWPTDGQMHLPFPVFLIDHVMTTPDIRKVAIETGPNLGSDHLPVIATLALP
jgi:endonuclease/exonuclease/phosphatase (EEP) superfamily protein YafD